MSFFLSAKLHGVTFSGLSWGSVTTTLPHYRERGQPSPNTQIIQRGSSMNKRASGIWVVVFFVSFVACMICSVFVGEQSSAWRAYVTRLQTEKAIAQADADRAHAALLLAEGDAAILKEAAAAVASDRQLVTIYALSGNAVMLVGIAGVGVAAGVMLGRRGRRREVAQ